MNIMYLTDVGFDTPNSNNRLILTMLNEFMDAGHNVYLVQSHSSGKYEDIPESLKNNERFSCDTIDRGVVNKSNFVKRYLNGIKYEFNAKKLWKKKIDSIDIVLLQSHFTAWCAAWLLKKYQAKVVFSIYDIFPGEAYTNGSIKSKFIYDCLAKLQKYLYKKCNHFFVLTNDMKDTLISLGVNNKEISVIPVWFDEENSYEIDIQNNKFAEKYNLDKGKKYIQYAGSIGVSYDFDFVLDVAKKLSYRDDIVFQIVGEGIKLEHLKQSAKMMNLTNIQFIPWQPLEILSDVYSFCTLQIVPLMKDVIRNSYPSKILPLMACSRVPVVSVEKDTFFYNDINESKVGLTSPICDVDAMVNNILYLIDNDTVMEEYKNNAYKYVYDRYTSKINTEKMLDEFLKLFKN